MREGGEHNGGRRERGGTAAVKGSCLPSKHTRATANGRIGRDWIELELPKFTNGTYGTQALLRGAYTFTFMCSHVNTFTAFLNETDHQRRNSQQSRQQELKLPYVVAVLA